MQPEPDQNAGRRGRPRQRDRQARPRARRRASTQRSRSVDRHPWCDRDHAVSALLPCSTARRARRRPGSTCPARRARAGSAITSASRCSFSASCERSASGCHRCSTPVAKAPSLRRTPACSSRTSRSESSLPQPLKLASKPSTRSRSARQTARLQERAPSQACGRSLAQRPERQAQHRREAIEPAAEPLPEPVARCPSVRVRAAAPAPPRSSLRQQRAIAGDEPAGLGEPSMGGDEIRPRQAVAVEEHDIVAARCADRAIADFAGAKAAMLVPDMRRAARRAAASIARPAPRSPGPSRRRRPAPRSRGPSGRASERSTASSASSRL